MKLKQQTRPVVIPLGEKIVVLAAVCVLMAAGAGIVRFLIWMFG